MKMKTKTKTKTKTKIPDLREYLADQLVDQRARLQFLLDDSDSREDERALYRHALDTLDFSALADLQRKHCHPKREGVAGFSAARRAFEVGRFLRNSARFCNDLGLVNSKPLTIFDIACGPGYFSYVCRFFGHKVVNLDKPYKSYSDVHRWLGNDFIADAVLPKKLLPPTPRCDLVTAFSAAFHIRKGGVFLPDEWDFFFSDLVTNHLKPNGRIFMILNNVPEAHMDVDSPAFADYISSRGGVKIGKRRLKFDDLNRVPKAWFKLASERRRHAVSSVSVDDSPEQLRDGPV